MNVKISYTVQFDEVPEKVSGILVNISKDLSVTARELEALAHTIVTNQTQVSETAHIRRRLAALDMAIGDCYSILTGYMGAKLAQNDPELQEKAEDGDTNRERGSGKNPTMHDLEHGQNNESGTPNTSNISR